LQERQRLAITALLGAERRTENGRPMADRPNIAPPFCCNGATVGKRYRPEWNTRSMVEVPELSVSGLFYESVWRTLLGSTAFSGGTGTGNTCSCVNNATRRQPLSLGRSPDPPKRPLPPMLRRPDIRLGI
jgi:hypothetical protein